MDTTFLQERITRTKSMIASYEDAIDAIIGGVESYTLDTGQTRQTVKRHDLSSLQNTLDTLYNRYAILCQRLNGGSSKTMRPCW